MWREEEVDGTPSRKGGEWMVTSGAGKGRWSLVVGRWQLRSRVTARLTTSDQQKLNILRVRASHYDERQFDIQMGRVSGIPSDSEVSDTRGLPWAAAVSRFCLRFEMFFQ
jgi:hypothetical protein